MTMAFATSHAGPRRLRGLLVLLLAMAAAAPALAQDRATIVLRNGDERVTGQFEDLYDGTIYIRRSLHDQRRIPLANVQVIDFTGAAQNALGNEDNEARGAEHLLVMRDGTMVRGRLLNIEGGEGSAKPGEDRIVSFRTAGGEERRLRPSDIARIYLGNYARAAAPFDQPAAPEVTTQGGMGIAVRANQNWTRTGITVREGDMVTFRATGQVALSGDANDVATPGGSRTGREAANAPIQGVLAGALLGRVGNSTFGIGDQTQPLRMPASGELWLGVNDDAYGDNRGQFNVDVQVNRNAPTRRRR